MGVVLRHKGMLERTTPAEAERRVLIIRECEDIIPQKTCDQGRFTVCCLRLDGAVGMDDWALRQTSGIPAFGSGLFNIPASKTGMYSPELKRSYRHLRRDGRTFTLSNPPLFSAI